jgi:hypothetical protein
MSAIPPPEAGPHPVRWKAGTDPATDQSGAQPRVSLYGKNAAAGDVSVALDSLGQVTPGLSKSATYSAAKVGLVPASSPTDIFTITGSATKIVRVTRIAITATTTSATPAAIDCLLVKRSTANSGGTSTGSPTPVPHDSTNAAATATILAYTVNPTTGDIVGTALRNEKLMQQLATLTATDFPGPGKLVWEFPRPIVLRGIAEVLAVNLNGVSVTGTASFDIDAEWTEAAS